MFDSETELNKATGELMVDQLVRGSNHANDQLIKTSGWLTASLLAINGGGALATLNMIERLGSPFTAAGFFGGGILFAMLSAVAIQAFQSRYAAPLQVLIGYWAGVKTGGQRNPEYEKQAYAPIIRLNRFSVAGPVLGWISGALFFVGAGMLALDAQSRGAAIDQVCGRLQHEMMRPGSAPQSRELFETIKCRFAPN